MTTARTLPGAEVEFDEFVKSDDGKAFTGDCGEFAEISAVHIVTGLPLTAANLHTIVNRDVAHGWASANGGEPLVSIARDLDTLHLLYTLYNYPGPANWLDILQSEAGIQPVIIELANGQNLAGDESGLHFHFICVVGVDSNGNFLCCDGDNVRRDAEHLTAVYTPSMIDGAKPCGLIVVRYPQKDPFGYIVQEDGSIVYNDSGIRLEGLVAAFVKEHNLQEEVLAPEYWYNDTNSVTPFTNGVVLVNSKESKEVFTNEAGEVIRALIPQPKTKVVKVTS